MPLFTFRTLLVESRSSSQINFPFSEGVLFFKGSNDNFQNTVLSDILVFINRCNLCRIFFPYHPPFKL